MKKLKLKIIKSYQKFHHYHRTNLLIIMASSYSTLITHTVLSSESFAILFILISFYVSRQFKFCILIIFDQSKATINLHH
jgi:hypothetical protein